MSISKTVRLSGGSSESIEDAIRTVLDRAAVTISGIAQGEVTAAHIHRGPVGVNGPIVYNLSTVGFTQVAGSITLTAADVADLKAGNFYVNAHSLTNPGGFAG